MIYVRVIIRDGVEGGRLVISMNHFPTSPAEI
jgi:hypothetical protein